MFFKTSELLTVWHVFLSEPRMVSRKSWKSWIKAASLTWRKSKFQGKFHAENSEKKEMSRKPDVKRDTRFPRRRRQKCRKEPVLRKRRGNSYGQNEFSLRILTKLPPSRSISFLSGPMLQTCSKGLCHDEWHIMIKNEKDGKRWNMMKYDETWWNHWIYHILRGPGRNWSTACEESFSLTQSKHTVFQKKNRTVQSVIKTSTILHTKTHRVQHFEQGSTREHKRAQHTRMESREHLFEFFMHLRQGAKPVGRRTKFDNSAKLKLNITNRFYVIFKKKRIKKFCAHSMSQHESASAFSALGALSKLWAFSTDNESTFPLVPVMDHL